MKIKTCVRGASDCNDRVGVSPPPPPPFCPSTDVPLLDVFPAMVT